MNSNLKSAMLLGIFSGIGAVDPFAFKHGGEVLKVDLKIPKHGEPGSRDSKKRNHKKQVKTKTRKRKNKRGF